MPFHVSPDDAGQRLDRFIRKLLPAATLGHLQKLLREGRITLDGDRAAGKARLTHGAIVAFDVDPKLLEQLRRPRRRVMRPWGSGAALASLRVVFRDEHLLVIDKPGGLPVHAGTGVGDDHLVARVLPLLPQGEALTFRPAPAHRIDRGASGLVIFGLSGEGLRQMVERFRQNQVQKTYLALVRRQPKEALGEVDTPLAPAKPNSASRPRAVPAADGKPARTRWRHVETRGGLSLLEVEIEYGRTHQIRAHLASVGMPLAGDRRYGDPEPLVGAEGRFGLHAARLAFAHPVTGTPVALEAPLPADLAGLLVV